MRGNYWKGLVAIGLICLLAAGAIGGFPLLAKPLAFISGICFILAVIDGWPRRIDPYSIEALRREEERLELEAIEHAEEPAQSLYCVCCGTAYSADFSTCPECARKK